MLLDDRSSHWWTRPRQRATARYAGMRPTVLVSLCLQGCISIWSRQESSQRPRRWYSWNNPFSSFKTKTLLFSGVFCLVCIWVVPIRTIGQTMLLIKVISSPVCWLSQAGEPFISFYHKSRNFLTEWCFSQPTVCNNITWPFVLHWIIWNNTLKLSYCD